MEIRKSDAEKQTTQRGDTLGRQRVQTMLDEIEHRLGHEDPAFVRRMRSLERAAVVNTVTIVLLLVVAAVLLAVGLGAQSWFAWFGGGLAFIAAFAVDNRYRAWLQRTTAP